QNESAKIYTITVYNTLGAELYQTQSASAQTTINLSGYPAGIYCVKVETPQTVYFKKVVLQR
ncbi:MAG TPA: T9SS type A sorting domain-containing protein, partial [Bacteroidia bacterium]|nr:T9SS type A sorting domain-containing protein [Bacteroidia bacterium]